MAARMGHNKHCWGRVRVFFLSSLSLLPPHAPPLALRLWRRFAAADPRTTTYIVLSLKVSDGEKMFVKIFTPACLHPTEFACAATRFTVISGRVYTSESGTYGPPGQAQLNRTRPKFRAA